MKEQWRQQMQQKLADYKRPAPEVSWDALDKALASNRHKVKTVPMWTRRIAAAVVALVAVTGGYLAFHYEEAPVDNKEEVVSSLSEKASVEPKTTEPQQTNETPVTLLANNTKAQLLAQSQSCSHKDLAQDVSPSVNTPESTPQEEQVILETPESQVEETPETQEIMASPKRQTLDEPYEIRKQKTPENRLMAMVYLSNGLSGDNLTTQTGYFKSEYYGNTNIDPVSEKNNWSTATLEKEQNPFYKNEIYEESINHHLPVRLGLSLRYRLNDRWSIESGLAYTRLRSDFNFRLRSDINNNNGIRTKTEQTLSYIGIPVTASYLLTSGRYVNLYVSAGGMVEKMVKGRLHHEYVEKNLEHTESVSIRPLQFSVNGGLGVEFNLSHLFSLYAEPGVGYYFDNGSDIPTYYQDKPFSFNLNLGLRFNIK